ncbi:MAG TPA: Hsp20/alpha crystallin family protein [Thermomicrobiales bacterium]|nr:Hsp20/alpha crystallin family protein [Thermomicrobiales bacterium]
MSSHSTSQSQSQQDHLIQQGAQTHPSQQGQQGQQHQQGQRSQQNQSSQLSTRGQGGSNLPAQSGQMRRTQLTPFDLLDEMTNQMARLWGGNLFGGLPLSLSRSQQQGRGGGAMTNFPRVDIFEKDNQLVVKAELPGVKKQDIDLSVEDGDLIIQAHRHNEQESDQNNVYRMERQSGTFYREIPLPEGVQADKIQASLNDGVLEVDIPMPSQQQTQGQKIQVK